MVFRLATRRPPRPGELARLRRYYDEQRAEYARDPALARDLVSVGVVPADAAADPVELAALMNVTTAVMNSPDAYMLR
jgi:hypothetical protein